MSRTDEIHRLNILSALQTRRTINISQHVGDSLLGVRVIDFDEGSGQVTLEEELTGSTASINIADVSGTSFEYLVYTGDDPEPVKMSGNILQVHFNDAARLTFHDGSSAWVQKILWVNDRHDQVIFVDEISLGHIKNISHVAEIHTHK